MIEQTIYDLVSLARLASAIFRCNNLRIDRHIMSLAAPDTATALEMPSLTTPVLPSSLPHSPQNCGSIYGHPICSQPRSPLLGLPAELWLLICSNVTLLPSTTDWNGAFFSCRQFHHDMLDQLNPNNSTYNFPCVRSGPAHPVFGWIRSLTCTIELEKGWCTTRIDFKQLYVLHLDELQLLLTGGPRERRYPDIQTLYGDLTTLGPPMLATPRGQLQPVGADINVVINCKKTTLTLEQLASADYARDKQTTYEVAFGGPNKMYLFTVIQNRDGQQVERSYAFDTRFETPTPLSPYEAWDGEDSKEHTDKTRLDCDCDDEMDQLQKTLCVVL
jgi:hypothetical protein